MTNLPQETQDFLTKAEKFLSDREGKRIFAEIITKTGNNRSGSNHRAAHHYHRKQFLSVPPKVREHYSGSRESPYILTSVEKWEEIREELEKYL
jgi:hypothetical protein